MGQDELKIYDLVAKRFLAIFHPDAEFERTRVETDGREQRLPHQRPAARRAGLARRLRRRRPRASAATTTRAATSCCRSSSRASPWRRARSSRCARRPSRRGASRDASLLGGDGDRRQGDRGRRAARGDEGLRDRHARHARRDHRAPDRAATYIEREGRALVATEKGIQVIRLLERAPAHLRRADRRLGAPARPDRARRGQPRRVHRRHREVHDGDRRGARQAEGRPDRARQARPVPGLRPRDQREPQGLLVLVARGPWLRLRDLEEQGGQVAAGVGGQGADRVAAPVARGAARTRRSAAPPSRSRASAAAPAAPSARSCGSSRRTRASGASSSTRSGRRSRRRARRRRSRRRREAGPPTSATPPAEVEAA